jgi:hypothetical protein
MLRSRQVYSLPRIVVFIAVAAAAPAALAFDEIDDALRASDAQFRDDLAALAAECRKAGQSDAAKRVAAWFVERSIDRFVIYDVDDQMFPAAESTGPAVAAALPEWQAEFARLRRSRAAELFGLAQQAAKAKRRAQAHELLWEALREDPDHAQARKMLGFERVGDRWATAFAAKQLRAGRIWHKRFGWIAKEDVDRYERGERRADKRWITAEQDGDRHRDIRNGWRVETEHYVVTTNHSLEEGARLAAELERLHRAWRRVFVDYWVTDGEFERMFEPDKKPPPLNGANPGASNRHRVICYRDREEYVRALQASQPRIGMSLGVYLDAARAAYFFAGDQQHPATVLHEATHQLFKESKPTVKRPGERHGMWLVEAAACYMESLSRRDGYDTLGERDAGRFEAATEKITEQFYVPLSELAALSSDDLQRRTDIAKVYSQSAGLMTFLLHADGGRYRLPTMVTLDAIYAGKAVPGTLSAACDAPYERLDAAYIEFIKAAR